MNSLLLAIDIGNSAATFGLFQLSTPRNPRRVFNMPTSSFRTQKTPRIPVNMKNIAGVIISSVVPAVDKNIARALRRQTSKEIIFVAPRTPSKVKNLYKNPSEVGADRIVNARAAMEYVSGPCIVVDFGTATTFDCVASGGKYLGGVIAPGPVISAEALFLKTAKLPLVVLRKPARILGRTTLESIKSGLYHGYRGLVTEIAKRLKEKMGPRTKIVATGGQAKWLLKNLSVVDRHIPFLTLSGLVYYWKDIQKNNK